MSEFTASNGMTVGWSNTNSRWLEINGDYIWEEDEPEVTALREFFQAEEDERLGRWRWPENTDYVVYPLHNIGLTDYVKVIHETDGYHQTFENRAEAVKRPNAIPAQAAVAYFDAHPDPKPWHDARPGDVWALTVDGEESAFYPSKSLDRAFTPVKPETGRTAVSFDSFEITAGRRLWPEGATS